MEKRWNGCPTNKTGVAKSQSPSVIIGFLVSPVRFARFTMPSCRINTAPGIKILSAEQLLYLGGLLFSTELKPPFFKLRWIMRVTRWRAMDVGGASDFTDFCAIPRSE